MAFSSKIQVLKVNELQSGISKKTNLPWDRLTAECMLLDDNGALLEVGKLTIPKPLREKVTVGTFVASFTLVVARMGDRKGEIETSLTDLTPIGKTPAVLPSVAPLKA
jgi:hypothetical protein